MKSYFPKIIKRHCKKMGLQYQYQVHRLCFVKELFTYVYICTYCHGCDENGRFVPGAGIEPTSLAFRASVLPLHHSDVRCVACGGGGCGGECTKEQSVESAPKKRRIVL